MRAIRATGAAVSLILVILVRAGGAQTPDATPGYAGTGAANPIRDNGVHLLVGRSTILNMGTPITRVSLTTPEIADALVTSPQQVLVHGKAPGTISLFVWEKSGTIRTYEVVVQRDLSELQEQLRRLFPGEAIEVSSNGKDVVVSGTVSSKHVLESAADVAAGYVEKKENVVNLLQQQEGVAGTQIMLRVRFAEVSRTALQELGAGFFTGIGGYRDYLARTTTQQFPAPIYDHQNFDVPDGLVFSDFLNLFLFNTRHQVGTLVKALQSRGLFQSLAEPNLIALNGREASFLAGGEYPYPVVQGTGDRVAISITFKEFGIRLHFTPTIVGGDLINLRVRPEVSSLDFSNAVILQGFRIPALSSRRTETEVELRDGQTFAIAGLMNRQVTETMQKIPGIGDIPILGTLFRSRALQKGETELVVMITPHILQPGSPGVTPHLPDLVTPYLDRPARTMPAPPPHEFRPRSMAGADTPDAAAPAAVDLEQERRDLERAREEMKRKAAEEQARSQASSPRTKAEQRREAERQKQLRKEEEREARRRQAEARAQERLEAKRAREQAKRDEAAARAAKRAEEEASEAERRRNQTLAEAEAKLKAAEAAYEAEIQRTRREGGSSGGSNR
jgi:pilus assembly protein CpaC